MDDVKKKLGIIVLSIICIISFYMIISGFSIQTSAYITDDFTVSEDGSEITFKVGIGCSMGYVRGYKDEGGKEKPHYLKFYSAWGGFNSTIGAKDEFVLKLDPEDTKIYVYHGANGCDLTLQKDINFWKVV